MQRVRGAEGEEKREKKERECKELRREREKVKDRERAIKYIILFLHLMNNKFVYTQPYYSWMLKNFAFPYLDEALFLGLGC